MGISGGFEHSVLLDAEGAVHSFGRGDEGQLGLEKTLFHASPCRISSLPRIVAVSAGSHHTACVGKNGDLYVFGRGHEGQLGLPTTENVFSPTKVRGMPSIQTVSCGAFFTFCITNSGWLWSFGENTDGQLGLGHTNPVLIPTQGKQKAQQVACGYAHTLVVAVNGALLGCGDNSLGQLGTRSVSSATDLTKIPFSDKIASIHCGGDFSVVTTLPNGHVHTSGYNGRGQLGDKSTRDRNTFKRVPELASKQLACGWSHVMCLDVRNRVWAWGDYGAGDQCHSLAPVLIHEDASVIGTGKDVSFLRNSFGTAFASSTHSINRNAFSWSPDKDMTTIIPPRNEPTSVPWRYLQNITRTAEPDILLFEEIDRAIEQTIATIQYPPFKSIPLRPAPLALGSWTQCMGHLERAKKILHQCAEKKKPSKKQQSAMNLVDALAKRCSSFAVLEMQFHDELAALLEEHPIASLSSSEGLKLVWWRMDLLHHFSVLSRSGISGLRMLEMSASEWMDLGLSRQETCRALYTVQVLRFEYWRDAFEYPEDSDCLACSHHSRQSTRNLLKERNVAIHSNILDSGWITPYLVYLTIDSQSDLPLMSESEFKLMEEHLQSFRENHNEHIEAEQK